MKHILFAMALLVMPLAPAFAMVEVGQPAPEFTGTDLNGNEVNLSDYKGKPVVLEWTNHHCPYVRKHYDTKNMQKTQQMAVEKGAVWLTIVSSAEGKQGFVSPEEAAEIVKEEGAHPTAKILDPSGEIGKLYSAKVTPHMFVIDTEGKLVYAGAIDDNPSPKPEAIEGAKNYVLSALDSLAAGEKVEPQQTAPYGCAVKYK